MKKNIMIKKLNEDDILEILLEHFQDQKQYRSFVNAKGLLIGEPGKDMRFISVFGNDAADEIYEYHLEDTDKKRAFNEDFILLQISGCLFRLCRP